MKNTRTVARVESSNLKNVGEDFHRLLKEKNKGITLISLIITIVILLILVAVSIDLIVDGKLFDSAGEAVSKTNEKVGQQQGRVNELMGKLEEVEQSQCTHVWGEWTVTKEVTDTENGTKERTCSLCGKKEVKEILKIIIGAYINGYDPSVGENGRTISTSYISKGAQSGGTETTDGTSGNGYGNQTFTVESIPKWRILGEENGQIIITTADPVLTSTNGNLYFRGQAGYVNIDEELNKVCAIYGQGKYADTSKYRVNLEGTTIASGGRSIKLEDIGCTINANPSIRIYKKQRNPDDAEDTTYYIYYGNTVDSLTKSDQTSFTYWGDDSVENPGKEWKTLGDDESVTIKYYGYTTGTRTSKQTEMIFKESDGSTNAKYWLASSRYTSLNSDYVFFGARFVNSGYIDGYNLYFSYGYSSSYGCGVRPAVYLKSDINLSYDTASGEYTIEP